MRVLRPTEKKKTIMILWQMKIKQKHRFKNVDAI